MDKKKLNRDNSVDSKWNSTAGNEAFLAIKVKFKDFDN